MENGFINTEKRDAMMAYITATATADSEQDIDALLKIFNPGTSRKETGKNFEEALGYDPITYFDIQDVLAIIDEAMGSVSTDGVRILAEHKNDIVAKTMDIFDERRERHLRDALAVALVDYLQGDDLEAASEFLTGEPSAMSALADDDDEDEPIMDDDFEMFLDDDDHDNNHDLGKDIGDDDMLEFDEEDDD